MELFFSEKIKISNFEKSSSDSHMKLKVKFSKKFFLKNLEFRSLVSYLMMMEKDFSKKFDGASLYVIEVKIWKKKN